MKNHSSLFTAIVWGIVLMSTIASQKPVEWYWYAMTSFMLSLTYAWEFFTDNTGYRENKTLETIENYVIMQDPTIFPDDYRTELLKIIKDMKK